MDAQGLAFLEMLRSAGGLQGYAPQQPSHADLQQLVFGSSAGGVGALAHADLTRTAAAPSRYDYQSVLHTHVDTAAGLWSRMHSSSTTPNRFPERAARGLPAQHDDVPAGDPGTTSKTRIREKNRQAQRRFRERQRTLVNELRVQVDLLCRAVNDGRSAISQLERENRIMKALLMQNNNADKGGGEAGNGDSAGCADGALVLGADPTTAAG